MEAIYSSETSVLTRVKQRLIPEDGILLVLNFGSATVGTWRNNIQTDVAIFAYFHGGVFPRL
jgi:hypothetical protein